MDGNGSPLDARANPFVYTFIMGAIAVVLVLFLVYLLLKKIRDIRSSPAWIEAHKNLATTSKNIKAVAKTANLTTEEKNLLAEICHKYKPRNIEYLLRDEIAMGALFKNAYIDYVVPRRQEELKAAFFALQFKLEKARDNILFITTTSSLAPGQEFTYKDADGTAWILKLNQNTPQGLVLDIPKMLAQGDKKPEPLSKFMLTFTARGNISYTLLTRVIRYHEQKDGSYTLIASSTNTLKPIQRRMAKRMMLNEPCTFSAVKVASDRRGRQEFTPLPNKYEGTLQDLSASGCSLSCRMPIKQGQYLNLNFNLGNGVSHDIIGMIVMTKKSVDDDKEFILHVKFEEITLAARNDIYAYIYGYQG